MEAGGGLEFGQGRVAIGDPKKRLELAVLKAAVGQVREEYAFSERRACGLMTMAVSSYRYQSRRSDEGLRARLVELARARIATWRREYNEERPHSSLGYRTPEEFAREMGGEKGCGKGAAWKSKSNFSTALGNLAKGAGFPLSHSPGGDGL